MNFVFAFSKLIKISEKTFVKTMKTFRGLPHRFENFYEKRRPYFYK